VAGTYSMFSSQRLQLRGSGGFAPRFPNTRWFALYPLADAKSSTADRTVPSLSLVEGRCTDVVRQDNGLLLNQADQYAVIRQHPHTASYLVPPFKWQEYLDGSRTQVEIRWDRQAR
jgi:hypothetical protein